MMDMLSDIEKESDAVRKLNRSPLPQSRQATDDTVLRGVRNGNATGRFRQGGAPNACETTLDSDGWTNMSKYLRDYDEMRVKDSKEDIDTLLVFAGLFSAVLTAFVLVSYSLLQPDNGTLTVQLLAQISMQLTQLPTSNGTASTPAPVIPTQDLFTFHAPASAFRINGLWFASLTFSLITASLGMLVKQWLREYMAGEMISPKERCRVRHFRNQGVERGRVFEIAAFLPMLLQLALILFFVGLLDFIRMVDATICWAITSIVALYLLFYAMTTVSPMFSAQSPFKTPLLKSLFSGIRVFIEKTKSYHFRHTSAAGNYASTEEIQMRKRNDLDVEMIVAADATFLDPQFFDNVQLCMRDFESTRIVTCVRRLLEQRAGNSITSLHQAEFAFWRLSWSERVTALSILLDSIHVPIMAAIEGQRRDFRSWEPLMEEALFGLHVAIRGNMDPGPRTITTADFIRLLFAYKVIFAKSLLKSMCHMRLITYLYMPNKRARYLPDTLSTQAIKNFLSASTALFEANECKPIELWTLLLRFFKSLPDDTLHAYQHDIHQLSETAAQAILADLPNCAAHQYLHLQSLAASETGLLAERIYLSVSERLTYALHDNQWAVPRAALEEQRRRVTAEIQGLGTEKAEDALV